MVCLNLTGDRYIHIVDFGDMLCPKILASVQLDTVANDIEMCGDYVAVAQQGERATDIGKVVVFEKYHRATTLFNKVYETEGTKIVYVSSFSLF